MLEHEKWSQLAKDDLMVAKALINLEFFSSVTYHCQQSAEKALKAYLVFKKHEILKSHDLNKLVGLCEKIDVTFEQLYDSADHLSPYATRFRYPTEFEVPDREDSELAIKDAQTIIQFVHKKLTEPEIGQMSILD
jgi:HEPN domain-containing protein